MTSSMHALLCPASKQFLNTYIYIYISGGIFSFVYNNDHLINTFADLIVSSLLYPLEIYSNVFLPSYLSHPYTCVKCVIVNQ